VRLLKTLQVFCFPLHNGDFFRREAVQLIHQPVNLRFQGRGVGSGVGLLGGKDLVNNICDTISTLRRK